MGPRSCRSWLVTVAAAMPVATLLGIGTAGAQVFTVGEKTATANIKTDFSPTRVELPDGKMTVRGRRELVRDLEAEQGFAKRALPLGAIVTLIANGNMSPSSEEYKLMIYKKGQSAAPGDRVIVTALEVKPDRILIDLNGGPYVKHRFLRHVQVGVGNVNTMPQDDGELATGCRVTLLFEGGVPEVSAPEVKALLEPVVDFGVKSGAQAYADTLPAPVKDAIKSHEVLVGMNHRMVIAALGQPETKIREGAQDGKYEEWIYGHQPQTVRFVRFVGDRVSLVKVAALGKPVEIHDHDELGGFAPPLPTRTIAMGDAQPDENKAASGPPTLKLPGETNPVENAGQNGQQNRKVQFPDEKTPSTADQQPAVAPASSPNSGPTLSPRTQPQQPAQVPPQMLRATPAAP